MTQYLLQPDYLQEHFLKLLCKDAFCFDESIYGFKFSNLSLKDAFF